MSSGVRLDFAKFRIRKLSAEANRLGPGILYLICACFDALRAESKYFPCFCPEYQIAADQEEFHTVISPVTVCCQ